MGQINGQKKKEMQCTQIASVHTTIHRMVYVMWLRNEIKL